jgi:hypothetical protein
METAPKTSDFDLWYREDPEDRGIIAKNSA